MAPRFAAGKALVMVEVALSLTMVTGAAVFIRSFRNLSSVPTGFAADHVSVIVKTGGRDYILAGDATYTEAQLLERRADGISPNPKVAVATIDRICDYLASTPTVYLPAHDPATAFRLRDAQVTRPLPHHARDGVRNPEKHEILLQK